MVDFIFNRRIFKVREMAFTSVNCIKKKKCDVIYLHSADEKVLTNKKVCWLKCSIL